MSWEGTPHPQQRPRVTKGGRRTYRPDQDDQDQLRAYMRAAHEGEPLAGSVVLVAVFYVPDLRTRDVDNMMKHVADSAIGVLFTDDRQVTASAQYEELDREKPRTVILYGADELTTVRR